MTADLLKVLFAKVSGPSAAAARQPPPVHQYGEEIGAPCCSRPPGACASHSCTAQAGCPLATNLILTRLPLPHTRFR